MTSSIRDQAVLVHARTRAWSSRKSDKRIKAAAVAAHGVATGAVRGGEKLLVGDKLEAVESLFKAANRAHLERSAPWLDAGPRILLAAGYQAYTVAMREYVDKIEHEVDVFARWYDYAYAAGFPEQRKDLNGLFDWVDYPQPGAMREKFRLEIVTLPLPDADDFRVDLGAQQIELIKRGLADSTSAALSAALDDVCGRVVATVGHLAERMHAYDPSGDKVVGKFHDTLIGNVRDLASALPGLAIPGLPASPAVMAAAAELAALLAKLPAAGAVDGKDAAAAELREDDALRAEVAAAADAILARMAEYV